MGLGTRITEAINHAAGFRIKCIECKKYLRTLNRTPAPYDAAKIVEALLPSIGLPATIRDTVGGTKEQRVWLRAIVERVIAEAEPANGDSAEAKRGHESLIP